jgi:Spy/CpxP family protein refolding chaperone
MKSFRSMFPILGVVAVLAGCSGSESTNTGQGSSAISATTTSEKPEEGRPHAGRGHGPGHGGPDFLVFAALHENSINLSAEQRTTIEGLIGKREGGPRGEGKPEGRPAPDKAKTAELAAAIRSGKIDAAKLQPNRDGAKVGNDHQAKSAEKLATLHKTLTKEQRATLVDAIVAKMAKHGEGKPEGRPEGMREGRGHGEGGPMGHLTEGLDLTQAQKDQIKAKLDADRPAPPSEADRTAMKAAMDAKLQTFKADNFDANAFVAPPANAAKLGGPSDHMAKELNAVVSVLTAEQREKLAQKIEQGPPARH